MADAPTDGRRSRRTGKLTRDRILTTALRIADGEGIEALSMRRLGQALGVEAMSLYKHLDGKEAILDGIADLVMLEVEVPDRTRPWREAIRASATSMHRALLRHPWASAALEGARSPGPARLGYLDGVVSVLLDAGFTIEDVARAFMILDSYVYGYTMQVLAWPFDIRELPPEELVRFEAAIGDAYPGLAAMAALAETGITELVRFEEGLDLLLDGLEREHAGRSARRRPRRA